MTLGVILTSVCQSFSRHLRLNKLLRCFWIFPLLFTFPISPSPPASPLMLLLYIFLHPCSDTAACFNGCASCGGEDVEISADEMWKGWRESTSLHPNLVWRPPRMLQTAAPEQLFREHMKSEKFCLFFVECFFPPSTAATALDIHTFVPKMYLLRSLQATENDTTQNTPLPPCGCYWTRIHKR